MSNSHFSLPCHGQPWTCSTGPGNHTKRNVMVVIYMQMVIVPMMIVIAILLMTINYDETTWSRVVAEAAAMQERTPRKTRILSLRIELFTIQLILSIIIIIIIIIARGPSSIIIIVIIFISETCAHLSEEEKALILRNQRCKDKNARWKCCSEILMFT